MIAIGIGCQTSAKSADIAAAIAQAVRLAGQSCDVVASLKRDAVIAVVSEAAATHGAIVHFASQSELAQRSADCVTWSAASVAAHGLPSLAEAAALVAAGDGSKLIIPRLVHAGITAAVATSAGSRDKAKS